MGKSMRTALLGLCFTIFAWTAGGIWGQIDFYHLNLAAR